MKFFLFFQEIWTIVSTKWRVWYCYTKNTNLFRWRFYYTLKNNLTKTYIGIHVFGKKYEFIAFSSSQLRERSCWFFESDEDLDANKIRNWLGNFTDKIVAKRAARMGQALSSTTPTVEVFTYFWWIFSEISNKVAQSEFLDNEDVKSVLYDKYIFSDGVGTMSAQLAYDIAKKLNWGKHTEYREDDELSLQKLPSAVQVFSSNCHMRYLKW